MCVCVCVYFILQLLVLFYFKVETYTESKYITWLFIKFVMYVCIYSKILYKNVIILFVL